MWKVFRIMHDDQFSTPVCSDESADPLPVRIDERPYVIEQPRHKKYAGIVQVLEEWIIGLLENPSLHSSVAPGGFRTTLFSQKHEYCLRHLPGRFHIFHVSQESADLN
jgi:hypothetical protein